MCSVFLATKYFSIWRDPLALIISKICCISRTKSYLPWYISRYQHYVATIYEDANRAL